MAYVAHTNNFPERSTELDFQIYLEMYCLDPSMLLLSLWKMLASFVLN